MRIFIQINMPFDTKKSASAFFCMNFPGDVFDFFSQMGTVCNIIPGHKRTKEGGLHHMYVQFEKARSFTIHTIGTRSGST